ncbi:leucine-rich repeat domain-containing protein [uncultured Winogradskyella sp.]|uniref:leucine-rich repeat domain-containing protein n=1 Tax=uncultured Winogradskyella sp. TaxID=395353 RepID=UPI0026359495|nr:leucine-rich repeat domain-containing protein [uncultured Winogradskyella sp.]
MKKQLLILMTLCISVLGYSQVFFVTDTYSNSLRCSVTSTNTVSIILGSTINNINVDIPASVSNGGSTYNVTEIGSNAFSGTIVSSVNIPNTITSIGQSAFLNTNLASVVLPSNLVNIDNYAFQGNQLTELTIPSNVTNIGIGAFRSNNSLTTVTCLATIPPSITTANNSNDTFYDGFTGNRSDIDLIIPSGTTGAYVTDPGALWTGFNSVTELLNVGDTFIVDYITYEVTSVAPDNVEAIDYDMTGGTVVDIPATVSYSVTNYNVTSIGLGAFQSNQLTSVTIPNSITNIKDGAFNNNPFTSIIIPESVTNIGSLAFAVNYLNTIVVLGTTPPTITTGGGGETFANSSRPNINLVITNNLTDEYVTNPGALWTGFKMVFEATSPTTVEVSNYDPANGTSVVIPATVTAGSIVFDVVKIDDSAFENIGLTSVTIPDSVTSIGISAFNTNNLTSVTIPDSVTLIGTTAFATNPITNLSLGANVTDIGIGAFVDNNLSDVTIPSNVNFIGLLAFANNPLASVTSLATIPPTITTGTNDTFAFNRSNIHLHIPPGTLGVYVTDPGALWTGFNPVTEDANLGTSDFELANAINVYNTKDELKIISNGSVRLENYTIYSIAGAKIKEGTESTIAIDAIANGIYVIELNFDNGRVTKKFIK